MMMNFLFGKPILRVSKRFAVLPEMLRLNDNLRG